MRCASGPAACFESAWLACRQFWSGGRWVRISDELEGTQFIGLNRQVTLSDELAGMDPERRANIMQRMMIVPNDPRLNEVIRTENDITDLAVDIVIEEGADVPALQAEQFQSLMQLATAIPGLIPPDVLIAASSLKDKDKLLERFRQAQESQTQVDPMAQANAEAEIRGKHAKASADEALAALRGTDNIKRVAETEKLATEAPWIPVGVIGEAREPEPQRQ